MLVRSTLLAIAAAAIPVMAQSTTPITDSQKLDSLMVGQKSLEAGQKKILLHVADEPLADKNFGVELNIPRLLFLGSSKDMGISGGFSLFNVSRSAEVAFPLYYYHFERDNESILDNSNNFTLLTIDAHYRQFLGRTQDGFYLSGFGRLAHLRGYEGDWIEFSAGEPLPSKRITETKFGVGVGLGYRVFSHLGLYWGTSFSIGRYVIGESERFRGGSFAVDDYPMIIDWEILKFGWAF